MNTETVRLTPKEFEALEWVDAQAYIDDYADPDNAAETIEADDITPEQFAIEHELALQFSLTPEAFTFVRESAAFRQATYGLKTKLTAVFETTPAQRRTLRELITKLGPID